MLRCNYLKNSRDFFRKINSPIHSTEFFLEYWDKSSHTEIDYLGRFASYAQQMKYALWSLEKFTLKSKYSIYKIKLKCIG